MTPQERQLVDELFEKLARLEASPRDADAERAIAEGLARAPHALYPLVQTVLVQDEALKRADARIRELGGDTQEAPESFLDSMRAMFGGRPSRGSVPSVRQDAAPGNDPRFGGDPRFANAAPMQNGAPGQGESSFLGTAAAAAAGYIGGAMLMNSIGSLFGSNTAHAATPQQAAESSTPWDSGAGNSDLARDAGADRIGERQAGLFGGNDEYQADPMADDFDGDFGGDL